MARAWGGGGGNKGCDQCFRCRGVLLIWIIVKQRRTVLAVGADGVFCAFFFIIFLFFHSPWETARYRLKYCL